MTVSRPNTPGQAHAAEAAAGSRPHTPASKLAAAEGARPHTPGKDGDKPASRVGSSANVAAAGSKHGSAANLAAAAAAEAKPASRTASAANVAAADARPHTPGQVSSRPGSANTADRHLHANPAAAAFWKEKFGSDIGRVAVATFFAELSSKFEIPLDLLETNQAKLGSHINTKGTGHVTVVEFAAFVGADDVKTKVLSVVHHEAHGDGHGHAHGDGHAHADGEHKHADGEHKHEGH